MNQFKLSTPIVREGAAEAMLLAINTAALALKFQGLAPHNAVCGDEVFSTRIPGDSPIPVLSFDGDPATPEQADEVAIKLTRAVVNHLLDGDTAHVALDKKTPPIKTPDPLSGGTPTTFKGADANGGIVIVASKPGVTYEAMPGPAFKVNVTGDAIKVEFIAGTTTPIEEANELSKYAIVASATPTGTGRGARDSAAKTTLGYGTTTASRCARLNELKAVINAHAIEPSAHNAIPVGAKGPITAPDATDDATSYVLAKNLLHGYVHGHIRLAAIEIHPEGF